MCLVVFSYKNHPNYKLVIAANRDEFHKRPTKPAEFWDDSPNLLGGRDLEANGTWLGVTTEGKISLVTNYRDLKNLKKDAPSRGHLVSDFLKKEVKPKPYLEKLDVIASAYNGFNLLLGNQNDLWYYSNQNKKITMLGSGLYGLSNALLETPWPKLVRAKEKVGKTFERKEILADEVLDALFDDMRAPEEQLPDTGIGLEKEKMLSSIFIKSQDYGTRCSTLVTVDKSNHLVFYERTYDLETFDFSTRTFEFKINSKKFG